MPPSLIILTVAVGLAILYFLTVLIIGNKSNTANSDEDFVTLVDCPVGLFLSEDGELCLKTEYSSPEGKIDAYIVSSGEYFWGLQLPMEKVPSQSISNQRAAKVRPVTDEEVENFVEDIW